MKSILNKVLVVLVASALFAGNVEASQGKRRQKGTSTKSRLKQRRKEAREEMSQLDFFERVKEYGDKSFAIWSEEDRIADLEDQYGSLEKAPKNVQMFLLGNDKNKTIQFRSKYKEAALKEFAGKATKEATDNLNQSTEDLKQDPENPDLQQKVQEQTGILAAMTKTMEQYLSPGAVTAVKASVGAGALALAAYGATYAIDFGAGYMGYQARPGEAVRSYVGGKAGEAYEYVTTSRPAQWVAGMIPAKVMNALSKAENAQTQANKLKLEADKKAADALAAEQKAKLEAENAKRLAEEEERKKQEAAALVQQGTDATETPPTQQ